MKTKLRSQRIDAGAIVVGYVMSRLDVRYLDARGLSTWRLAFAEASESLGLPGSSVKNLRDEFDPFHGNARQGWRALPH